MKCEIDALRTENAVLTNRQGVGEEFGRYFHY